MNINHINARVMIDRDFFLKAQTSGLFSQEMIADLMKAYFEILIVKELGQAPGNKFSIRLVPETRTSINYNGGQGVIFCFNTLREMTLAFVPELLGMEQRAKFIEMPVIETKNSLNVLPANEETNQENPTLDVLPVTSIQPAQPGSEITLPQLPLTENPDITIIIPAGDDPTLISKSLRNLSNSSYRNYKVIIINNAGLLFNPEPSVTVVDCPGANSEMAWNKGASLAESKYLFFNSPEAEIFSNALQNLYTCAENFPENDFFYGSYQSVTQRSFNLYDLCGAQDWNPGQLFSRSFISALTLVKREKFLGFDVEMSRFSDWDLWLRMFKNGSTGRYVGNTIYKVFAKKSPVDLFEALGYMKKKHPDLQV